MSSSVYNAYDATRRRVPLQAWYFFIRKNVYKQIPLRRKTFCFLHERYRKNPANSLILLIFEWRRRGDATAAMEEKYIFVYLRDE